MVQLRPNDVTVGDYNVKFRITIEGVGITIKTKPNFTPQPTTIPGGGIPLVLYGEDLLEYFSPNNLDFLGLSRKEFDKTGKLPEGVYRFNVEVLDYNRGTVVSSKGTTIAWIILNDPPLLNLPRKDTKIKIFDPTNIPFTWTPRHTGSPNSAFSSEYVFRIVEVWPANRNPYDAFLSQPTLFEATTTQSQIIYGVAEPALIPGRKYAWQVQARDVDGKDLFKNLGKSEVYVFQFGDALGMPENFRQEGVTASTLSVRWEPAINGEMPDQYRIRYKPVNNDTWYESVTIERWLTLTQLQTNSPYEIQIRAEKGKQFSEYSAGLRVKTAEKKEDQFACGTTPAIVQPEDTGPLLTLTPGDIVTTKRKAKIVVTEAKSSGNGSFDGKGIVSVPLFGMANIRVSFSGRINNKYELVAGGYRSTYNANSKVANMVEEMHKIGEQKKVEPKVQPVDNNNQAPKPDIIVQNTIDSVFVNEEGKIVVVDEEGKETTYEQVKDTKTGEVKETVIADKNGDKYVVQTDPTTGKSKVTKVEGEGLQPATGASTTQPKQIDVDKLSDFEKLVKKSLDTLNEISNHRADSLTSVFSLRLKELKERLQKEGYDEFLFSGPNDDYFKVGMSKKVKSVNSEKLKKANEIDKMILNIYYADVAIQNEVKIVEHIKELLSESKFMEFAKGIDSEVDKNSFQDLSTHNKVILLMGRSFNKIKTDLGK